MVIVDQYSGRVLYTQGSRAAPGGRRLAIANRAFHTGDAFGVPSKIVMSLVSLMAPAQLLTGIIMWWKRWKPHAQQDRSNNRLGSARSTS